MWSVVLVAEHLSVDGEAPDIALREGGYLFLASPEGAATPNRLEKLKGEWSGFHSVRINDQWRLVFRWTAGNASDVQIVDYH